MIVNVKGARLQCLNQMVGIPSERAVTRRCSRVMAAPRYGVGFTTLATVKTRLTFLDSGITCRATEPHMRATSRRVRNGLCVWCRRTRNTHQQCHKPGNRLIETRNPSCVFHGLCRFGSCDRQTRARVRTVCATRAQLLRSRKTRSAILQGICTLIQSRSRSPILALARSFVTAAQSRSKR